MTRILATLGIILFLALPVRAEDAFVTALEGLGDGFSETAEAVEKLGATGDPRALALLRTLQDGGLQKTTDGHVLIQQGDGFVDAVTGAKADATDAEEVRLNNRVRQALRGALGRLQILSPDAAERAAAADAVFRSRNPDNVPALKTALARETVPAIRTQLELALAASQLVADDEAEKRDAIARLGSAGSTEAVSDSVSRAPPLP